MQRGPSHPPRIAPLSLVFFPSLPFVHFVVSISRLPLLQLTYAQVLTNTLVLSKSAVQDPDHRVLSTDPVHRFSSRPFHSCRRQDCYGSSRRKYAQREAQRNTTHAKRPCTDRTRADTSNVQHHNAVRLSKTAVATSVAMWCYPLDKVLPGTA